MTLRYFIDKKIPSVFFLMGIKIRDVFYYNILSSALFPPIKNFLHALMKDSIKKNLNSFNKLACILNKKRKYENVSFFELSTVLKKKKTRDTHIFRINSSLW